METSRGERAVARSNIALQRGRCARGEVIVGSFGGRFNMGEQGRFGEEQLLPRRAAKSWALSLWP